MTENLYLVIGVVIWAAGLIALPVFVGYKQAKNADPPEGFGFFVALFLLFIIPFWGFVLAGAIVLAVGYPIVQALTRVGEKLAERRP